MKLFKNLRENFKTETKSTKKGLFYALLLSAIGTLVVAIAPTYPILSEFVSTNQELLITLVTVLSGAIVARFGAKKDA